MSRPTAAQIETWIRGYLAESLNVPVEKIPAGASFNQLGLDSSSAVALVGDLEDWLDMDVDAALPYDFPTVEGLSAQLARLGAG